MSTTRYINGQPYLIPDQGDTYVWGTDLSNWIGAISNSTLQKNGGPFTLSTDVDFGPSAGLKTAYVSGRSNAATSGLLRLSNTDTIQFRNAAGTGNNVLSLSGDVLTYSGGIAATSFTGDGSSLTNLSKAASGLGNVDNTSDLNKPISTAQQAALNLKADIASPAFTGIPLAPTAPPSTNSTQIATTAFVSSTTRTAFKTIPMFRAFSNQVSDQMLSNGVLTPVLYNNNSGNGTYNPANGRWQPSLAGWWQVDYTGLMNYSTATAWNAAFFSILKNGTEIHRCSQIGVGGSSVFGTSGSTLVYMNGTTDYLQIGAYGNTNSGVTPYVNFGTEGPKFNNFSAFLAIPDA